ncbi:MAG: 50S ribosomal protein L9 [Candidatus Omnitrophica bacterium]|nr:50S ribosomal protein L9 [Candidatus Omnitrophota bacterium]
MEVILKKDIPGVGKAGAVIKVKDGYAHNYLLPNGLALLSTASNLKKLEQEKQVMNSHLEKVKQEAERLKTAISALAITIPVLVNEEGKLYGNIAGLDIARALKEEGFDIDKNTINLAEPIKSLGIYEIPVRLHPEVLATLKVWIVKK